jgi:hypothetical protein
MPKSRRMSSLNQYDRSTLDPFEAELGEPPVRQQPKRPRRDALAARSRADDVANLALPPLALDSHEEAEPQELALVGLDREAGARPVAPALLVRA